VICIVTDLPSSARQSFIGIDNRAAGKTAARLVSEFARSGSVGILTGSLQQRDHQERLLGFRSLLETLTPSMRIGGVEEALDREEICYRFTKELFFSDLLRGDLPAHRVYQLGPIEIFLRENLPPPESHV
jgi:LacI family transcriptional regulator